MYTISTAVCVCVCNPIPGRALNPCLGQLRCHDHARTSVRDQQNLQTSPAAHDTLRRNVPSTPANGSAAKGTRCVIGTPPSSSSRSTAYDWSISRMQGADSRRHTYRGVGEIFTDDSEEVRPTTATAKTARSRPTTATDDSDRRQRGCGQRQRGCDDSEVAISTDGVVRTYCHPRRLGALSVTPLLSINLPAS